MNTFSTQELREAQIDTVCQVNSNAHEHGEWPVHPITTSQETDDRYVEDIEKSGQMGLGEGLTQAEVPMTMRLLQQIS